MSDCYKNMPSNRPQCRPPTGETCRVVDPRPSAERENEVRSKTTRGEGLVPRWGGGGERQNRRSQFVVPSRNSGFSNLGVPAPAGMSDCYKNMPSNRPQCRLSTGETCRVVDPWPMAERENVERSKTSRGEGLVPRWGGGGARQNPRSQFAVPSHNSVFSYLGGPATAGMTDRCESMSRTPIRDALKWLASAPANASIRHSREGGNPRTNIPRKKANRDTTTCVQTATPLRLSGKNRPEPRYGPGIQMRWRGGKNDTETLPGDGHPFSYLGVSAPAGMSDCYESMSRTPIRDRPLRQPLIRHSRHPFVNSAPHSSFQRSKACPVPRYGAGIQKGWEWQGHHTYARIQASRDFHSPIWPSQAHVRIQRSCRIRLDKSADHVNDTESL